MPKQTMKSLQSEIYTLRASRDEDIKHQEWQTREINNLRDHVKSLEADKSWLRQMHSALLQALRNS